MESGFLERSEGSRTLDNDFGSKLAPRDLGRVSLSQNGDFYGSFWMFNRNVAQKRIFIGDLIGLLKFFGGNGVRQGAVGGIVLEQVGPAGDVLRAGSVDSAKIEVIEVAG